MRLDDIITANKIYDEQVEANVQRALTDAEYQEKLMIGWRETIEDGEWIRGQLGVRNHTLPSGLDIPILALPHIDHPMQIARYQGEWGLPGKFPFGLSIYPTAQLIIDGRLPKDIKRMFAGLGTPEDTNKRFQLIAAGQEDARLSTAFDTHTLLGRDADDEERWYDIGEGGVSVSTFEDVQRLYQGFLDKPDVSISMTINGPSVWMTAARIRAAEKAGLPLRQVLGTSQTDPLKEADAQNELVVPLEASIKIALDMMEWCIEHCPNYFPINVSGYHIEQKGATAIQQAAFTAANGLYLVGAAKDRCMNPSDVAPRLPFFFTSGSDLEYIAMLSAVRKIWAVGLKGVYGIDNPKSLKAKAHIQTSGRSLYPEVMLNNITRTAIQLFYAMLNYPQSLHSNSYDEPVTTPTPGAVIIAADAQAILQQEIGGFKDIMGFMSDSSGRRKVYKLVQAGILGYFKMIEQYGGVLEAKAAGLFRGEIDASSARYEQQVLDGTRRIIRVNAYPLEVRRDEEDEIERINIPDEVKRARAKQVLAFKERRNPEDVARAIRELQETAVRGGNVFEVTYRHIETLTIGEWTRALQHVNVYGKVRRTV